MCVLSVGLNSRSECFLDVTKSRVLRLVQSWPVSSSLSHHFNSCSKLSSINHLMQYSLNSWTTHASGQDTNKHASQDASKLKSVQKTENKYFRLVSIFFFIKCARQNFSPFSAENDHFYIRMINLFRTRKMTDWIWGGRRMKFFGVLENDSRDPLGYSERVSDITERKITFFLYFWVTFWPLTSRILNRF